MDLLGIGAAVQGISGVVQGKMNSDTARRNTDLTNAANRELAEYGYSKDLEMWEKQNEYNNPASQMGRLKAAGLNPNMVYGKGGATGNTSSQLPKYNVPKQDFNYQPVIQNLPNMLSGYSDFMLKNAQIDNAKEQRKILSAEAQIREAEAAVSKPYNFNRNEKLRWDARQSKWSNDMKMWERDYMSEKTGGVNNLERGLGFDIQYKGQRVKEAQSRVRSLEQGTDLRKKQTDWFEAQQLAKMGLGVGNMILKLVPGAQIGRGLSKAGKTVRHISKKPRYNSPGNWKNLPKQKGFN